MERINNICKRILKISFIPFIKVKVFKYPRKKELCVQMEYRVRQWGSHSTNGAWKCKSYYFHY